MGYKENQDKTCVLKGNYGKFPVEEGLADAVGQQLTDGACIFRDNLTTAEIIGKARDDAIFVEAGAHLQHRIGVSVDDIG